MRNLFLWEIKKNVKKSAVIGISVTAVVFLILFAAVYNMLVDFVKGLNNMDWEAGGEYGLCKACGSRQETDDGDYA